MHIWLMQQHVIRQLAAQGGRDMQIVDGAMYEITVRKIGPDTAEQAVESMIKGVRDADT